VFHNASWLELGWSATSLLGLILALALLAFNLRDEGRRRRSGVNGHVRLEVQGDIVLALGLFTVECVFLLAGVVQMGLPARPEAAWDPPTARAVLAILSAFILANLVVGSLIADRLMRRRARNKEVAARTVPGGRRYDDPPADIDQGHGAENDRRLAGTKGPVDARHDGADAAGGLV
jgi:hypothetical protein